MRKILLTSHCKLASGLKETLAFFLGQSKEIIAIDAYVDSTSDYMAEFQQFIDNAEEGQSVIFTDIYGGSVNQQVTTMVIQSGKKIPIITGMNLPVVLSVALTQGDLTLEIIQGLLDDCRPQIVELQLQESKEGDENDFFS